MKQQPYRPDVPARDEEWAEVTTARRRVELFPPEDMRAGGTLCQDVSGCEVW